MTDRWSQALARQPEMARWQRDLHQEPEVGLDLPDTHAYVADRLRESGLDPEVRASAGVTVRVPGRGNGDPVVLRADMDALPVHEVTGLPHASRRDGAMHACGHDLHMAMLLGAAACLVDEPPARDVVLAFQPGEETDRGAVAMLAAHENLQLERATAFAIHVHATRPAHTVDLRSGTFMAYGDWFGVRYAGPGAHASQPHLAGNPIVAAAHFVRRLGEEVERLSAHEHLVATVTEAHSGNTVNVIPTSGSLRGTLRTLSAERRAALHEALTAAVRESAEATGLEVEVEIVEGYPAVVNDETTVAAIERSVGDATPVAAMPRPSMVIEDFAYLLQRWPGAMVYLGAQVPGHDAFNHAADAVFDSDVLATGAALHLLAADGFPHPTP